MSKRDRHACDGASERRAFTSPRASSISPRRSRQPVALFLTTDREMGNGSAKKPTIALMQRLA